MTGAHVSVRAYAQLVLIGSGRSLVSSVLAWRHVLGANYARECERCDPVRKLPVIPSHGMEMRFGSSRWHTARHPGAPGLGVCSHQSVPSTLSVAAPAAGISTRLRGGHRGGGSLVQKLHASAAGRATGDSAQRLVTLSGATK